VVARLTGAVVDCAPVEENGRMQPGLVLRRRIRPAQARPAGQAPSVQASPGPGGAGDLRGGVPPAGRSPVTPDVSQS
jgi:hypothetical protein